MFTVIVCVENLFETVDVLFGFVHFAVGCDFFTYGTIESFDYHCGVGMRLCIEYDYFYLFLFEEIFHFSIVKFFASIERNGIYCLLFAEILQSVYDCVSSFISDFVEVSKSSVDVDD